MFGAGQRQAQHVDFLKGVGTNKSGRDLTRYGNHRNRIHHGICQTGNQVSCTGARGGDTDAGFAG